MGAAVLLALAGLALVDSTSVGTLVLPVLMLVHPRVRASRVVLYLATISAFYLAMGLVLLLGADALAAAADSLEDSRAVDWVQLVIGTLMLVGSFWPDTPWGRRARKRQEASGTTRAGRWVEAIVAADGRSWTVVSVALAAGMIEAASMLPYLGAVALISTSELQVLGRFAVLAAYVLVMALPALALLGIRFAAHRWLEPRLERVSAWLSGRLAGGIWWVVGIIGFLLAAGAASRIFGF